MNWSRRQVLRSAALLAAPALNACQDWQIKPQPRAKVVVIGGGFAGATLAKTLRQFDTSLSITLIEPKSVYLSCPASNWFLAGLWPLPKLTVDYQRLQDHHAIRIVNSRVKAIETNQRRVLLTSGQLLDYDRLVVAPGIDFRWDTIAGYDPEVAEVFPHAWQGGPQTLQLAEQLKNLPAGGVVLMSVPADPYRCPPGPYERASMMAFWLKRHNPHAKIIILDHKRSFSKQAQFEQLWQRHYGYGSDHSLIEWHCLADNPVLQFDARSKTLISEFGDRFNGDLINLIPPQQAGEIARLAGLSDATGWCQVKPETAQSLIDPLIHVLGDAAQFAPMPKSAFAAHSQAKHCALTLLALLNEQTPPPPTWFNTCYSLVSENQAISIAGVYTLNPQNAITALPGAGGISSDLSDRALQQEAGYAHSVYQSLLTNSFD